MAEGRAGRDAAEAAEERAERGPVGGGEEAPGVHEPAEEVRRGLVPICESSSECLIKPLCVMFDQTSSDRSRISQQRNRGTELYQVNVVYFVLPL